MSKQPLEGLTVRIFDPVKTDENGNSVDSKGSRGYRQYTEKIGSDKLSYSAHNWDKSESSDTSKKEENTKDDKQDK